MKGVKGDQSLSFLINESSHLQRNNAHGCRCVKGAYI